MFTITYWRVNKGHYIIEEKNYAFCENFISITMVNLREISEYKFGRADTGINVFTYLTNFSTQRKATIPERTPRPKKSLVKF